MLITNFSKASLSLLNSLKRYTESFLKMLKYGTKFSQGCFSFVFMPDHVGVMLSMVTASWRTLMIQELVHT